MRPHGPSPPPVASDGSTTSRGTTHAIMRSRVIAARELPTKLSDEIVQAARNELGRDDRV